MMSNSNADAAWEKFLNPDALKQNLLQGGLYLAAFEMLKDSLIGRPKEFFVTGFSDGQPIVDAAYDKEVLTMHKHRYTASALWWLKQGAISESDVDQLRKIREHRDEIAHKMPKMIGTIEHSVSMDLLNSSAELLSKIDNWWIQNIEAGIDPEQYSKFSQEELDAATGINSFFLSMMIPLVAGDDSQYRSLYTMWCEQKKNDELKLKTHCEIQ